MPYKKPYSTKTVPTSGSGSANGGPSKPVTIKPMFNKSKPTKHTKFPE